MAVFELFLPIAERMVVDVQEPCRFVSLPPEA